MPWGERIGSFAARVQGPKGRSAVEAVKAREAGNNIIKTKVDFMECFSDVKVDGHTKIAGQAVCRYGRKEEMRRK